MDIKLFQIAFALTLAPIGLAQEPTAPAAIDMEARKASVVTLESHIAQREQRLADLGQDIVTLDARIEKRVDELVKMLANLRDSQDSKTRISKVKQEAMDALKRGIGLYVNKRKEIRERVRTGDETSLGDLGKFDERISKRVDQIVELSKSFPASQDVDKYKSEGGSYWNGYYYENSSMFVEDASFLRIRTVNLSYTFNKPVIKFVTNLQVYAQVQNLWVFTKYKGFDPEVSSNGGNIDRTAGVDFAAYPPARTFTLGVNLGF